MSKIALSLVLVAVVLGVLACQNLDSIFTWRSKGTLKVAPGMTFDEVRQASSLVLDKVYHGGSNDFLTLSSPLSFTFELAGTGLIFEGCRFYSLETKNPDPKIVDVQIQGRKNLTWNEVKIDLQATEQKLKADGWSPITGEDGLDSPAKLKQALLGPAPAREVNFTWTKGKFNFVFAARRFPQTIMGEDPAQGSNYEQNFEITLINGMDVR